MPKRGQQLSRRLARRTQGFSSRRYARPVDFQLPARQRLFQRKLQEERRLQEQEKREIEKLTKDINAGKYTRLDQIPEKYRNYIGVTQDDLNQIQANIQAQREADLWRRAESLVRRKGKASLWIAKGSDISDKVRKLLGGISYMDSFSAFAGASTKFTSVSQVQAQNAIVKSAQEIARNMNVTTQKAYNIIQNKFRKGLNFSDDQLKILIKNKVLEVPPQQRITGGANLVSESIYKDLLIRVGKGDKQARALLDKVQGYIPQAEINKAIEAYKNSRTFIDKIIDAGKKVESKIRGNKKQNTLIKDRFTYPLTARVLFNSGIPKGTNLYDKLDGYAKGFLPSLGFIGGVDLTGISRTSVKKTLEEVGKLTLREKAILGLGKFFKSTRKIKGIAIKGDKKIQQFSTAYNNWKAKQIQTISRKTGIPISKINNETKAYFADVQKLVKKRYGLSKGAEAIKKYDKWINDQKKKLNTEIDRQENKVSGAVQPFKIKFGKTKGQLGLINLIPNPRFFNKEQLADQSKKGSKFVKSGELLKYINNTRKYIGLHALRTVNNLGLALPALATQLKTKPLETIATFPPALVEGIKQDFQKVKSGSGRNIADVAVEWYIYSQAFKLAGKGLAKARTGLLKISPGSKKFVNGKLVVRKPPVETFMRRGKPVGLKARVQKPSFKRPFSSVADFLKGRKPGQFKKFTKDPGLILKKQTVKSGASKLSKQAQLAGKEVTAVNASANQLTSWLRRKTIIRKPILSKKVGIKAYLDDYLQIIAKDPKNGKRIASILKKFDQGKRLTTKEFADINLWLQKNVAPNITLLERSLYLDPKSGLRLSRLGLEKAPDATLKDILKGNFRLWAKGSKPQVLVFEKAKIAKFPKALKDIAKKLRADKPLTVAETNRLIRWQVKTGGAKFKPIGSTIYQGGIELEITLAPGTWIKRIKKVGFFIEKGKKVSIVTAEVYKPSKNILRKIKLAQAGKLVKKELKALERFLSKELGRKIQIETPKTLRKSAKSLAREARRYDPRIPVVRLKGKDLTILSRAKFAKLRKQSRTKTKIISRRKTPKRLTKRTTMRKRTTRKPVRRTARRKVTRPKRTTRRTTSKPRTIRKVRRTTRRRVDRTRPRRTVRGRTARRTTTSKKKVTKIRLVKGFRRKKLRKAVQVYYVVIKLRGKKVNLNPRPLTLSDARDYLAYKIDKGLSRSAWFEPMGKSKTVLAPTKPIKGYFSRVRNKLRPYKIRVGKRKLIRNGYIEKRKYALDTPSEKRALRRLRKRKVKVKRRRIKRRPIKRVKRRVIRKRRRIKRRPIKRVKRRVIRKRVRKVRRKPRRIVKRRTIKPTRPKRRIKRKKRKAVRRTKRRPRRRIRKVKKRRKNGTKKRRI